MKKILEFLNSFIVEFDWKDLGIFKICLCAFGLMLGICVPTNRKKPALIISAVLFVVTLLMLLGSLFGLECPFCCEDEDEFEDWDDEDEKGFVMRISSEE